mmetsp:Transcript_11327/g.27164  ORF Transcript_11327/g.27164 Transcript_11327/m.27164 type:complete len:210 (+) Transcript_11327:1205-1834(+)
MEMPVTSPKSTSGIKLRNLWNTLRTPTTVSPSRSCRRKRGLVRRNASTCNRGVETTSHFMANRGRDCTETMAPSNRAGDHVADCRLVLHCAENIKKERGRTTSMGVQPLWSQSKVEMRSMSSKLLLLQAVPKCVLAHCSQACLLQTQSMVSVSARLRNYHHFCFSWDLERSTRLRPRVFIHSSLLLRGCNSWRRYCNRAQEEHWIRSER